MTASLPIWFGALAGTFLVVVVYWVWQSVRLLADAPPGPGAAPGGLGTTREALVEEKEAILRTLRDLEMDRDVGKLSERDFERLNGRTRARAREILRVLDTDIAPYRERARALIADASRKTGRA